MGRWRFYSERQHRLLLLNFNHSQAVYVYAQNKWNYYSTEGNGDFPQGMSRSLKNKWYTASSRTSELDLDLILFIGFSEAWAQEEALSLDLVQSQVDSNHFAELNLHSSIHAKVERKIYRKKKNVLRRSPTRRWIGEKHGHIPGLFRTIQQVGGRLLPRLRQWLHLQGCLC